MPKTAKTIFNTTEKSNFILNMKTRDYWKYNLKIMQLFLILMPIFSIVLEFAKVYSVPSMALSIAGVFAMVFVFIGYMKSVTPKQLILPSVLAGGMVVWGIVSLYNCYYPKVAMFGSDGRAEGLLSIVFYGCFFLLGAQLGTDDNRLKLVRSMLIMTFAECVWALLQVLPIGFPSYYRSLEPFLIFDVFLPSGVTGSPVFFASLLCMMEVPAVLCSVFETEKKNRIFAWICAILFVILSVKTQCILGIAGMAFSILVSVICIFVKNEGKQGGIRLGALLVAFVIAMGWVYISPSMNGSYSRATGQSEAISNAMTLYDGGIFWKDSAYRLEVSGYPINGSNNVYGDFAIDSTSETYKRLWKVTTDIIKQYPLAGTGEDNLVYAQMHESLIINQNPNTFDRAYNFYLQMAGTTGIPMLLLFLALMVTALKNGVQELKEKENQWLHIAIFGAVVVYLAVMMIGSSCLTVAPLFWMLAGCCCRMGKEEEE
ncbi:MAG: O-antigen ligase family protein [Oscillospiraceae bacterium]